MIPLRISSRAVARVDAIATKLESNRSQVLRMLLSLGLRAWDKGERP